MIARGELKDQSGEDSEDMEAHYDSMEEEEEYAEQMAEEEDREEKRKIKIDHM